MENTKGRFALTIYTDDGGAVGIEYTCLDSALHDAAFYHAAGAAFGHKIKSISLRGVKW